MLKRNRSTFIQLSPLQGASALKAPSDKKVRSLTSPLILTSLVDIFSVMVIFLIVSSSNVESLKDEGLVLPKASASTALELAPAVTYKDGGFYIDDTKVEIADLAEQLKKLNESQKGWFGKGPSAILVQANQDIDFSALDPLIMASSEAGIKQIKFAVIQEEK